MKYVYEFPSDFSEFARKLRKQIELDDINVEFVDACIDLFKQALEWQDKQNVRGDICLDKISRRDLEIIIELLKEKMDEQYWCSFERMRESFIKLKEFGDIIFKIEQDEPKKTISSILWR